MGIKACKHLEISCEKEGCTKEFIGNKFFWRRNSFMFEPPYMVQFCKKKGMIPHPFACLNDSNAVCDDFEEFEHIFIL